MKTIAPPENMTFQKSDPDVSIPNYNLACWRSNNSVWHVRLDRVIFGCRVHVQHEKCMAVYYTDICVGAAPEWQTAVFYAVIKYLEQFPEDIHPNSLWDVFPTAPQPKPIYRNLDAWETICEMAKLPTTDVFEVGQLAAKIGIEF